MRGVAKLAPGRGQVGLAERSEVAPGPGQVVIAPALKVRDFSFTSLSDAV